MNLLIKYMLLAPILVGHYAVLAQRQVIGRVVDKDTKLPIKEAKVSIQGTDSSTITNAVGYFKIAADTTMHLLISSPGYESGLIKVPLANEFQLSLIKEGIVNSQAELENFYKFFGKNLRYPEPARRKKISGRVYVSFETDSLGKVQLPTLLQDIGGDCGNEVLRVLKALPKQWIPLSSTNKFILPVTFKIHGFEQESVQKKIDLPTGKLLEEIVIVSYR